MIASGIPVYICYVSNIKFVKPTLSHNKNVKITNFSCKKSNHQIWEKKSIIINPKIIIEQNKNNTDLSFERDSCETD